MTIYEYHLQSWGLWFNLSWYLFVNRNVSRSKPSIYQNMYKLTSFLEREIKHAKYATEEHGIREKSVTPLPITDDWRILLTVYIVMGLLPDTENCRLRMRRECRERFPPPPISKETAG